MYIKNTRRLKRCSFNKTKIYSSVRTMQTFIFQKYELQKEKKKYYEKSLNNRMKSVAYHNFSL